VPTRVRSYSKINLGLAIGAPRPDGFHSLSTLYQTLALHDVVTVEARSAAATQIVLTSNDRRVPTDSRNTAWKMVEKALTQLDITAEVTLHIEKNLPIQGGMGAGSANAAAALIGLERELRLDLTDQTRIELATQVGSDVPLFLVGGAVLGSDRGQLVQPLPDIKLNGTNEIPCVIALSNIGVSTPLAFRDWDRRFQPDSAADLHNPPVRDTIEELSRTYASVFLAKSDSRQSMSGASGILPDPSSLRNAEDNPEKLQGLSREQRHTSLGRDWKNNHRTQDESGIENDLAENSLLALVRTGIENDFETVVFPQYPLLREIKRQLMGFTDGSSDGPAIYAALSGSGSALFGLYKSHTDAVAAQQRLQHFGVEALVTTTMPRARYWSEMFAE
jgi:4-diphosphocytidyl-2-C-methyl-D-erythritol kinase